MPSRIFHTPVSRPSSYRICYNTRRRRASDDGRTDIPFSRRDGHRIGCRKQKILRFPHDISGKSSHFSPFCTIISFFLTVSDFFCRRSGRIPPHRRYGNRRKRFFRPCVRRTLGNKVPLRQSMPRRQDTAASHRDGSRTMSKTGHRLPLLSDISDKSYRFPPSLRNSTVSVPYPQDNCNKNEVQQDNPDIKQSFDKCSDSGALRAFRESVFPYKIQNQADNRKKEAENTKTCRTRIPNGVVSFVPRRIEFSFARYVRRHIPIFLFLGCCFLCRFFLHGGSASDAIAGSVFHLCTAIFTIPHDLPPIYTKLGYIDYTTTV